MWYWCSVKNVPPWELRGEGDIRYPEDIAAIEKMDEFHNSAQKMHAGKSGGGGGKSKKHGRAKSPGTKSSRDITQVM